MSVPTLDVNQAFATERADQAAAASSAQAAFDQRVTDGKLVPVPGRPGQFRVNDPGSWDNNEILYQSNGRILPQHGLDENKGFAAVYSSTPMWHEVGNYVPGGVDDIGDVLKFGGIDFYVEQRDVRYYAGGELRKVDGAKVNVRDDTYAPLGVVGRKYVPFQNDDAFEVMLYMVGRDKAVWDSAGALRGGASVFVSLRLPEDVVIDAEGVNDIIRPFLVAQNSHDGSGKIKFMVTPWRPICGNTNRFAVRDAITSWGTIHTKNAKARAQLAAKSLKLAVDYFGKFAAEETQLAQTDLVLNEVDALIADLWVVPENASDKTQRYYAKRAEAVRGVLDVEVGRVGSTLYAAEQAITGYLDNVAPKRAIGDSMAAARATAVLEGSDDDIKSRAHKQLLMLVNR